MENYWVPVISLLAICLVCLVAVMAGVKKFLSSAVFNRVMIVTAIWLVIVAVLAATGFFKVFVLPPRIPIVVILPVTAVLIISFRPAFKNLLAAIPPHWLVMMQSFRIIVELWLWYVFAKGLIPEQMTFEGRNLDILSGILGLVTGYLILKKRKGWKTMVVIYNIIGLILLLNIVIVAILSFPGPTRYFMNEPSNSIIAEFPFIYLPGVLVVLAFALHIFSLRQIAISKK